MSNPSEINRNRSGHFAAGTGNPEHSVAAAVKRSNLEDVDGPSDSDLSAIESGSSAASSAGEYYTPERIEESRKAFAKIDPAYSALRGAREGTRSVRMDLPTTGIGSTSSMDAPSSRTSDVGATESLVGDITQFRERTVVDPVTGKKSTLSGTGETSSGEGAATSAYEEESTGRGRRFPAAGMGAFEAQAGASTSPFSKIKESGDTARKQLAAYGLLLARRAGRCDSPGCQMLRATGMQLTGQTKRMAGSGIESNMPAIPAVHTEKRFYPEDPVTGKQNRKNPQTIVESKPANPNDPEWKSLTEAGKGASSTMFTAEDMLSHSHADEDAHLAYVQERIKGFTKHLGEYKD